MILLEGQEIKSAKMKVQLAIQGTPSPIIPPTFTWL